MLDGDAGARVERQLVVQLLVPAALDRIALDVVNVLDRLLCEIADSQTAHLARGRHVSVEQGRRRREHRRDIVEPVAGIVDRKPLARPDVHGQQIADGVAVLGAVQPMNGRTAWIRIRDSRAVHCRFEIRDERAGNLRIGARADGRRRHFAGPQLPHHLFPHLSVFGYVRKPKALKRETRCLQSIAMASDAVGGDQSCVLRCSGRNRWNIRAGA